MANNRYIFTTTLEGFINLGEPSGKYNNCCFSFRLTPEVLEQAIEDREELLVWARSKVDNPKRIALNPEKWDDAGLVKYSFEGETGRPRPLFIDSAGEPVPLDVIKTAREGTEVELVCQQTPYTKPAMGTTIKVLGGQLLKLVSGNGAVDSGSLDAGDLAALLGKKDGFKVNEPQVRREEKVSSGAGEYDF
jgi:hypothetical protein